MSAQLGETKVLVGAEVTGREAQNARMDSRKLRWTVGTAVAGNPVVGSLALILT